MDIADLYKKRKAEQTSNTTEKPSSAQTPTASKSKSIKDLYNERRNGVSVSDNASAIESAINDLDKRMNQYVESYNTSLRSAKGRYSDRGNKYVSDTAEYLKMMQEMQKNANTRATTLRADMEKYKDYINEDYYKTALANLDAIGKGYADFVDYASKDNDFYGQFNGDEELYNRYFNSEQKDLGKIGNWQPSGKSGMEDLAVRQLLGDKKQEVTPSEPPIDLGANMSSRDGILKGNDAPLKSKDNLLQILSKQKEIKVNPGSGGGGGYDRETKEITASPILTPEETAYVKLGKDLTENAKSDEEFFKWVALGRQEADNYTLNKRTFNAPKSTNANDIPRNLNYTPTDAEYYGEFLTDEEKDIYAYYLAKEKAGLVDKGTADEYLYALAETSNARRADFDYTMQLEGNPAYELAFGLSAGTEQFFRGMSSWFDNRDYIPSTANEIMSGKVREDLAKFGDLGESNINGSSLGQVLYDTITTTANMLPSIVLSSVTAGAGAPQAVASAIGSVAMGASAGGQARRNMINAGYSKEQATLYGILDGACEAYLQNVLGGIVPLGNGGEGAFGKITEQMLTKVDNAVARVAIKLGGEMASEGLEESLQEVIEPWLYSVITNTDFEKPGIDQILYAGLLGAVSSIIFSGVSAVGEAVNTRNLGKAIQTTEGGVDRLKKIGSLVDPKSVAGELVGRVNEFSNPYTIGRLYNEIGAEFNEQTVGEITERLVEKGVPEIFAKRLANGMANVVNNGAELNAVQAKIIEKNSVLADVLREKIYSDVTPNEITEALINRGVPETEARTIATKTANNGVFGRDLDYIEQFYENNPNEISFDNATTEEIYNRNKDAIADVYARNEANAPVSMQLQSLANRTLGIDDTYAEPDIDSRVEQDNLTWRMRNDVSAPKGAKVEGINQQISTDVERNLQTIAEKVNQSNTTPSEAFLNEIAKQYGYNKQTAEQFVKYYDERVSPEEYASDFNRAYWAARFGIKDTNTKSSLNQFQTRAAQSLAEIDRNVQTKKTLPQGVTYDGKVKFADGKTHKLNTTQRANFSSIEKIVKTTKANSNVDVKVFESVRKGNKRVLAYDVAGHKAGTNAPNGFYDPNTSTIYIDLYAGNNGEGAMLWTFAHELVHYVRDWKVSAFNKLADFVVSELSKTDIPVESLIEKKMAEQRGLSYDGAYEEVIADSLSEAFTSDGFNAEALAEKFNAIEDKGLLAKIKEFFTKVADVLKGLYAKLNPQTTEARIIREHQLNISKMASLLVEGVTEAGAATPTSLTPESGNIAYSLRESKTIQDKSIAYYNQHKPSHISDEMFTAANEIVEKMASYMLPYLDITNNNGKRYLPEEILGKTAFKNGSYGGITIENATICFRTLAYIDFTNSIKERIGRPLTVEESFLASQMLYDIAKEPQCLYCYVALDRKAYDGFLLEYIKQRDNVLTEFANLEDKSKANIDALYKKFLNGRKSTKPMRQRFDLWINTVANGDTLISLEDLTTEEKRSSLKEGNLADQINDAERYAQSASWAKKQEQYRSYNSDILNMTDALVKQLNEHYGLRFYSFSEYTPAFIVENMQQIRDASLKGLYGLAYTKKTDFARIFANTGMNINISVFGKMVDGKVVADERQGANWAEVQELRNQYKNVGAVFVATSDELTEWALAQDWIDVVIPFHIVRTGANVAEFYKWTNNTKFQADVDSKGRNKTITPPEHHNDLATFKKLIEERGLTPRFAKFIDNPNYMKLVNETRLSDLESSLLTPNFTEETYNAAKKSFDTFVNDGGYYGNWYNEDIDYNKAVDVVASDVLKGIKANEVTYGRQDIDIEAEKKQIDIYKKSPSAKQHGQEVTPSVRNSDGEKLTQAEITKDLVDAPKGNKYSERQYFDTDKDVISQSPFLATLEKTIRETTKYFPGQYFRDLYKTNPQYDYTTRLQNGDATAKAELTELVSKITSAKMLEDMLWYPVEAHDSVINYTSDGKWVVSVDSYKSLNRKGVKAYRDIIEKRKAELIDPNSIISKSAEGVKGRYMTLKEVRSLFDKFNDDADLKVLADKVFALAPKLQLAFKWTEAKTNGGSYTGNANYDGKLGLVQYNTLAFNDTQYTTNMWKAAAIVHELIHASTAYLINDIVYPSAYYRKGYSAKIDTATLAQVKMLNSLYWASYDALKGQYAQNNLNEFVAESTNAETRKTLSDIGNLDKYLVGIDYLISHFDEDLYTEIAYDRIVKGSTKYSTRNSDGETLSEGQIEYFKDSKVRDKDGNLLKVYHGTNAEFYTFDFGKAGDTHGHSQGFGFYLTPSKSLAEQYGSRVLEAYANLTKPMSDTKKTISKSELKKFVSDLVDYEVNKYRDDGMVWRDTWISNYVNTYEMSRQDAIAQITNQLYNQNGDDINIIYDIANGAGMNYNSEGARDFLDVLTKSIGYDGMWVGDEIVVFNPEQIKLTSNRNPTENQDIRYSTRNSLGEELSKGQQEYFKDSKVRDADGNLLVMYHGTNHGGFTVFDPKKADDKTSLFFTDSSRVANTYITKNRIKANPSAPAFTDSTEAMEYLKSIGFENLRTFDMNNYGRRDEYFDFYDPFVGQWAYGWKKSDFLNYATNLRHNGAYASGKYAVYLNLTNPLTIDAQSKNWNQISYIPDDMKSIFEERQKVSSQMDAINDQSDAKYQSLAGRYGELTNQLLNKVVEIFGHDRVAVGKEGYSTNTRTLAQYAKSHGYDGVIFDNLRDASSGNDLYANNRIYFPYPSPTSKVVIAFNSNQVKSVNNLNPTTNEDIRYSTRVTDKATLDTLNKDLENGDYIVTYKAMVNEGTADNPILRSPMANRVNGKQGAAYALGEWFMTEERPDLVKVKTKENGKTVYRDITDASDLVKDNWSNLYFVLDKGKDANGKMLGKITARYNPYEHSSNYVINDQFKGAYKRDNLVVVEMLVPKSEETSGYRAEYSKDPVGWTNWKSGKVGSQLAKQGKVRKVMLSRYAMPNRILTDAEVADKYAELLMGTDISVPKETVTKGLRTELEKRGVTFYSQRGVDNRTILANALDSTASTEAQRQTLARYKAKIAEVNADEEALADIKSQIKDIMFAKGERNMTALNALINKSKILQARIARADKALLNLEATKPLKDLLKYETDRIYKETVKDLKDNYKENAEIRDVKTRIKAIAEDFRKRLLNTTKSPIPKNLINGAIAVATLIDPTGTRQDTKVAQKFANTRQALLELKSVYDKIENDPNPDFSTEFDKEFSANILALADAVDNTPVRDMTPSQLTDVYNILNDIRFMISTATRQLGLEERITNYEAAKQVIEETNDIVAKGLKPGAIGTFFRDAMTNPLRAVREMYAYNEDARMVKTIEALNEGRKKADTWKMEQTKVFDELRKGKQNTKAYNDAVTKKVDMGLVDINGESAPITKMQAMVAILTYRREIANPNRAHLSTPALFPDIALELKGKYDDALTKGTKIMVDYDAVKKMEASLNEWDKTFLGAAEKFFNEASKKAINETTMQTKGRPIATEKAYIRYYVHDDYVKKESENLKFDKSILNEGILQSVKNNAPQQVIMKSLNKVLDEHIDKVGNIYGLSIPVRNYNKLIKTNMTEDDGGEAVKAVLHQDFGKGGLDTIERAFSDMQANRPTTSGVVIEKLLGSVKSSFVISTLASNLSVWMKQAASYPTAGAILSTKALVVGLKDYITKIKDGIHAEDVWNEIDEHTAQHFIRRKGLSMQELGEITQGVGWKNAINTKFGKLSPLNWIQSMDVATTAALWYACKAEVQSKTDIEVGSDEYWSEVTKLYEKVLEETQPMYDPLHRAEITKSDKLKNIILFQTQPLQNSGILREATYNLKYATKQFGKDSEQAKAARAKFGKAVASQVVSHVVFTLMTLISSAMLHRMSGWEDENKEVTAESVMENFGKRFMDSAIGAIFPVVGGYATSLYDFIDARINGKYGYTIISDATVDKLNSTIDKFGNAVQKIDRAIKAGNQGTWEATYKPLIDALTTNLLDVATYLGIPATNVQKIIQAIHLHAKDIGNQTFLEAGTDYTTGQSANIIYSAMLRNDDSKVSRYYDYAMADGVSDSSLRSKLKYNIEMSLFKNEITADEATDLLKKAYELTNYNYGDIEKRATKYAEEHNVSYETARETLIDEYYIYWDMQKMLDDDGEYTKYDKLWTAVESGKDLKTEINTLLDHHISSSTIASQITSHYKERYSNASTAEKASLQGYLINAYVLLGYSYDDAKKKISKW